MMASGRSIVAALCLFAGLAWAGAALADEAAVKRGAYLVMAGGCVACHTDTKKKGPFLAGGRPIKTPFGTFFGPNITPHPEYGIGKWSDRDFVRAMREGVNPDGSHYFPVFPYNSFSGMTDRDLADIKAYLFSVEPVVRTNRRHDIAFPFGWRFLQTFWKWLYPAPGPFVPDPKRTAGWNRGAYLVTALAHCGECHTPRTLLGGLDRELWLAGTADGPEGELVPNITPDDETGVGGWSPDDIATYLKSGLTPDGDFAGSLMADVIEHSTSNLIDADIAAIIEYLKSLKPIRRRLRKSTQK